MWISFVSKFDLFKLINGHNIMQKPINHSCLRQCPNSYTTSVMSVIYNTRLAFLKCQRFFRQRRNSVVLDDFFWKDFVTLKIASSWILGERSIGHQNQFHSVKQKQNILFEKAHNYRWVNHILLRFIFAQKKYANFASNSLFKRNENEWDF